MSRSLKLGALVATAIVLAACGSAVSQSNYDKINNGMTAAEVEAILGKPTDGASAASGENTGGVAHWVDGAKSITITYLNGKVVMKASSGL